MRLKTSDLNHKKATFFNIMTKINNDSVYQCLLRCLKQTELKYDEALVHSYSLSKHGICGKSEKCVPSFSLKNSAAHLSLILYFRMSQWVYSQPNFVML